MSRSVARKRRIGPLDVIEVAGDPAAPTVVLFHGFGADMNDLAPLADVIQAPKGTNFYFPNGHLSVQLGPHFEGRAWFPLRLAELESAMASGQSIDLCSVVPPGLKKARGLVSEFLAALVSERNISPSRMAVGGFSQGAMIATDVVLHSEAAPAGLVLLSGTLVCENDWKELAPKKQGLRFFQAHGAYDQVLSYQNAERLERLLLASGWKGRLQRFGGGHEIPSEVVIQLGAYLRQIFSQP